jgi:hypothetical protein
MTQRTLLIEGESGLTTTSSAANTLANATCIRVWNGHTDVATVSVAKSTTSGYASTCTFTMASKTVEFVQKEAQDIVWASSTAVKAAKVGFTN